jgi:serine/threonine protein kinase
MTPKDQDELLDQLVAQYADRVANGRAGETEDLLAQVAPEHRGELLRCLEMVELGSAPMVAPKPLVAGSVVGGCRVLGTLGRGGVATVYRAEQIALHREVALKVLRPGLAVDPRQVERFRREGLAIARLEHPNIVKIHDVGADAGHLFLVMEKVDGKDLSKALEQLPAAARRTGEDFERALRSDGARATASFAAPAPAMANDTAPASFERAVARLFAVVARAVAAAHAHGVIHRDLKPSNILLRRDGTPVVADFGLAKGDQDLAVSLTAGPIGTPHYMSPEQIEQLHVRVDARTDVYSLGVTLYEVLAGQRPFRGDTAIALFDAIRREFPPPVRSLNPNVSRDAEALVARAMARSPDERYATTAELADDLERLADGRTTKAGARYRPLSSLQIALHRMQRGEPFEYKSPRTLLGLPLVHIAFGPPVVRRHDRRVVIVFGYQRGRKLARAKGWLAIGDIAQGVLAIGSIAGGGVAIGALSCGVVSLGALALGGLALGGCGIGLIATGGVAVGVLAFGGIAIGVTAIGGFAAGHFAQGGRAVGDFVVSGARRDPEAVAYFDVHGRTLLAIAGSWIRRMFDYVAGR